jgi:hypothetical protein
MEYIKIGIPYRLEISPAKGSSFDQAPVAVLHNLQAAKWYEAKMTGPDASGVYLATWSADETSKMLSGAHTLEIYTDDTKQYMFKDYPWKNFATAITVSMSPNQNPGYEEPEESSSESES